MATRGTLTQRLRFPLILLGMKIAPVAFATLIAVLVIGALAPAATALATGHLVAAAFGGSWGVLVVAAFVMAFFIGQVASVLVVTLAEVAGAQLQRSVERDLIRAAVREGEDGLRARVLAASVESAIPLRQCTVYTARYLLSRTQAIASAALLVVFLPIPGVLVLLAFLWCGLALEREYGAEQAAAYSVDEASIRPRYLAGLAFDRAAARELRIFGAVPWALSRLDEATAQRPEARRPIGAELIIAYGAVAVTTVILLVDLASSVNEKNAAAASSAAAALVGATSIFSVSMDWLRSAAGAHLASWIRIERPCWRSPTPDPGVGMVPRLGSHIRFEHVAYTYPGSDRPAFTDLSFDLVLGDSLAVVGVNGAGKSTLVRLLTGVLMPDSGTISCDGITIDEDSRPGWRAGFAYLGQRFAHYPATLRQNVAYCDDAPERWTPMTRMLVADLDPRLEELDAPVLDRGVRGGVDLSGGQWQRVAAARAVESVTREDRRVLVLDEPTAALDAEAEARFFEEVTDLVPDDAAVVVVTHRLSGVRGRSEILVLDDGVVSERGAHDDLMAMNGRYAAMFTAQARRYQHA